MLNGTKGLERVLLGALLRLLLNKHLLKMYHICWIWMSTKCSWCLCSVSSDCPFWVPETSNNSALSTHTGCGEDPLCIQMNHLRVAPEENDNEPVEPRTGVNSENWRGCARCERWKGHITDKSALLFRLRERILKDAKLLRKEMSIRT